MSSRNPSEIEDLGKNMGLAFRYVQQIFKETAQLMRMLDTLMGKDWVPTYGNRTTKNVTSHLAEPELWLVESSFRIYDARNEPSIKKGITVTYWSEGYEVPILISGKVDYVLDPKTAKPKGHDHWDLYYAWFADGYEERKVDGTVYQTEYESEDGHKKETFVFAIPLASVESENDIRTRIYERLIAL